jgi:beta-glucosidase
VDEKVTPLYPFGHGLSYSTFEYGSLSIKQNQIRSGESVDVTLRVRNAGPVAGEEVVQIYTCDAYATHPRPVKELKGCARVALNVGESKTITFHLPADMLAYHDSDLNLILEPGLVYVMLGGSSEDIRLRGEFEIVGETLTVQRRVFDCPVTVN